MTRVVACLLLALLAAGCMGTSASPVASAAEAPAVPVACIGLDEPSCRAVFDATTADVNLEDVTYAEIGPFGCPGEGRCPNTLAARPSGVVMIERASADPIDFGINIGPGGTIALVPDSFGYVAADPSSTAGGLAGAVPYTLGHCGLHQGIDVDGSWWDPVGFVDADHPATYNETAGTFTPDGPDHAVFTTADGFSANLLRRVGAKHLPMCM